MSFFGGIESGINGLLNPLTSFFGGGMGSSQSKTSSEGGQTATAPATATSQADATTTDTQTTAITTPSTSTARSSRLRTSDESTITSTSSESSTRSTRTTLSRSTRSSSTDSDTSTTTDITTSSSSSTSTSSSTTSSAPTITPPPPPPPPQLQPSPSQTSSSGSDSSISTAGIIVAIIFGVALVGSIIWLLCRFCPPIRRRLDACTAKRRHARNYREAIDGPLTPEKDSNKHLEAAAHLGVPIKNRLSFLNLSKDPRYSWRVRGGPATPVHETVSPTGPNDGLGLGRVSVLRNGGLKEPGFVPISKPQMSQTTERQVMQCGDHPAARPFNPHTLGNSYPPVSQSFNPHTQGNNYPPRLQSISTEVQSNNFLTSQSVDNMTQQTTSNFNHSSQQRVQHQQMASKPQVKRKPVANHVQSQMVRPPPRARFSYEQSSTSLDLIKEYTSNGTSQVRHANMVESGPTWSHTSFVPLLQERPLMIGLAVTGSLRGQHVVGLAK